MIESRISNNAIGENLSQQYTYFNTLIPAVAPKYKLTGEVTSLGMAFVTLFTQDTNSAGSYPSAIPTKPKNVIINNEQHITSILKHLQKFLARITH